MGVGVSKETWPIILGLLLTRLTWWRGRWCFEEFGRCSINLEGRLRVIVLLLSRGAWHGLVKKQYYFQSSIE